MNSTINQKDTRWLTPIEVAYAIIMLAWMMFCGISSRHAEIQQHTITNTQTMQWTSDTSWAAGWR